VTVGLSTSRESRRRGIPVEAVTAPPIFPESLTDATADESVCAVTGDECRWPGSRYREGCWRRECAERGRPLYGIGPSVKEQGA
jgi:hypothetical protein